MKTRLTGRKALSEQLKKLAPDVSDEVHEQLRLNAHQVAETARAFAPKKSGDYAASIRVDDQSKGSGFPLFHILASPLWHLIEFGTRARENTGLFSCSSHPGTSPQPHFFPAYRSLRRSLRARASRKINKAIKRRTG